MPSTQLMGAVSGGQLLVSGNIYSGAVYPKPQSFLSIRLAASSPSGLLYIGLPNPGDVAPWTSGTYPTITSGGNLASGGLADALELSPGQSIEISDLQLVSGILTPRLLAPAALSGSRVFWQPDVRWYN